MKVSLQFRIAAILVMLLGTIHTAATPFIFQVFTYGRPYDPTAIYMFVVVGISTFLLGWLQWYTSKKVSEHAGFKSILRMSIIFLLLIGIGAVSALTGNPFAYVCLAIGIYELVLFRQL